MAPTAQRCANNRGQHNAAKQPMEHNTRPGLPATAATHETTDIKHSHKKDTEPPPRPPRFRGHRRQIEEVHGTVAGAAAASAPSRPLTNEGFEF